MSTTGKMFFMETLCTSIIIVTSFLSGKVRSIDENLLVGSLSNATSCQDDCLPQGHPCRCYTDGWIECENRNLTRIPKLPNCSRLLRFQDNSITEIDELDFTEVTNAALIDLTNNRITELRSGIFQYLTALTDLILHRNSIVTVNGCAFHGLVQLTSLDLSHNRITALPRIIFDSSPQLQEISLFRNNITDLYIRWFENKTLLKTVALYDNPWNCSCQLWSSFQYVVAHTNHTLNVQCANTIEGRLSSMCILCNAPTEFEDIGLYNLTEGNFTNCYGSVKEIEIKDNGSHKCIDRNQTYTEDASMQTPITDRMTEPMPSIATSMVPSTLINQTKWDSTSYDSGTTLSDFVDSTSSVSVRSTGTVWWVIVLIAVVVITLLGMLGLAMWCGKQRDKKMKEMSQTCGTRSQI